MTKIQLTIKTGEIDEAIVLCDKQEGSFLQMLSNCISEISKQLC
jgi:hypothetical protein